MNSTWPDSALQEDERNFLSVVVGNTHTHFAFHHGANDGFRPYLFWRTQPLKRDDLECEGVDNRCDVLSKFVSVHVNKYIFGEEDVATTELAKKTQLQQQRPDLTVYVVSTIREQTRLICKLFQSIPSRVIILKPDDFFTPEEGRYESMGIDRLSVLRGAGAVFGFPALVFDGGTATTYTAAGNDSCILGGGIGPGVHAKFTILHRHAKALPSISPEEVIEHLNKAIETKKPLETFSSSTKEAMMNDILIEYYGKLSFVIRKWIDSVGKPANNDNAKAEAELPISESASENIKNMVDDNTVEKQNDERRVCFTGTDGQVLFDLLTHANTLFGDTESAAKCTKLNDICKLHNQKYLAHYGISFVVKREENKRNIIKMKEFKYLNSEREDALTSKYLGRRVAKIFDTPDEDGNFIYRGTVRAIDLVDVNEKDKKSEDMFLVEYDDGDKEHLRRNELDELMRLFSQHGEKGNGQKKESGSERIMVEKNSNLSVDEDAINQKETRKTQKSPKKSTPVSKKSGTSTPLSTSSRKRKASAKSTPNDVPNKKGQKRKSSDDKKSIKENYVGQRVSKFFEEVLYFGTVKKHVPSIKLWKIVYDDSDEEEFDEQDLKKAIALYKNHKEEDTKGIEEDKKEIEGDTKGIEEDTKEIEEDTKEKEEDSSGTKLVNGNSLSLT